PSRNVNKIFGFSVTRGITIFISAALCTVLFTLKVILPSEKKVGGKRVTSERDNA
ncbi:MAG: hypothetical protein ACI9ZD_002869, partial [Paracoccaceae bacterium]